MDLRTKIDGSAHQDRRIDGLKVCACMHACMHIYIYIYLYIYRYNIYICIIHIYIYIYIIYIHYYKYTYTYTYIYIYIYGRWEPLGSTDQRIASDLQQVCMHVYIYIHIYILF